MSPELAFVRVRNYRAFDAPGPLELRPLTLLYGKNNAGKSTLVRLFGVLSDALAEEARGPFPLDGDAGGGADFDQARFDSEDPRLEIELGFGGLSPLVARWVLRKDDNGLTQVEVLSVTSGGRRYVYFSPLAILDDEPGDVVVTGLRFRGLVPEPVEDWKGKPAAVQRLASLLRDLRGRIQWIGAVRGPFDALVQRPAAVPTRLRTDGSDAAAALLINERAYSEVARWYLDHCARELDRPALSGAIHRLMLPPLSRPDLPITLRDAGEGMSQVLPVLTAVAMRSARHERNTVADGSGLRVIAIEEPTTHLHDDLQIAMVKHLAYIAKQPDAPRIVMETHARPMLLGVQLAIASGDITEDKVGVWWVDQAQDGRSRYRRVRFDPSGAPLDDTLMHVFDDERRVMRELARKRLERAGT